MDLQEESHCHDHQDFSHKKSKRRKRNDMRTFGLRDSQGRLKGMPEVSFSSFLQHLCILSIISWKRKRDEQFTTSKETSISRV